ncbi:hypothetical protein [Gilvibacter sediminis]|uniref:hypothetical protein n=1 Tax=Gilvibacter sediminis TaxID=379071 RepID=UPI0023507EA6|nr:hypothetical protein [Gilvibacter sediminis]MDC7998036.1 hypothetical protein [Gilvibacter sediminis]
MLKRTLSLLLLLVPLFSFSQEVVADDDLYQDANLIVYKKNTKEKYTGLSQVTKGNGHVMSQSKYEQGIILETEIYYNKSYRELANKVIYYPDQPYVAQQEIKYYSNKEGSWQEIKYNNTLGKKIKFETYKNGVLTYQCTYLNGKKHGIEFCLLSDGSETRVEYNQGKKIK